VADGRAKSRPGGAAGRAAADDGVEAVVVAECAERGGVVVPGHRRPPLAVLLGPVAVEEVLVQCVHARHDAPGDVRRPVD
jgi:hypothetical protein